MEQKKMKSGASEKDGKMTGKVLVSALLVTLLVATQVMGQESDSKAMSDAANANNPLADMAAFNIQNYHYSALYGTDESANTAWLRYAQPFGRWLMRASLPISTVPVGGRQDPVSGLGDFNVFFAYLFSDPSSPQQFGVGRPADLPDRLRWRRGAHQPVRVAALHVHPAWQGDLHGHRAIMDLQL